VHPNDVSSTGSSVVEEAAGIPATGSPAAPLSTPGALDVDAVARALRVDPGTGLTEAEAARRAESAGPNALRETHGDPLWRLVLGAALEPFVLLLAGSGALAILLGEARDGLLVLIGLLPIVVADVVTEYRGERALEALRAAAAPRARVRRAGATGEILAATLVPGDVVLLQSGDVVPADLRCRRSEQLLVDRSALTGESIPEPAHVDPDPPEAPVAERNAMLFAGTSIVGGRGEGIVTAIGDATELGHIAGGLSTRERRRSPLQRELDRLVRILLIVAIALIAFVTIARVVRGESLGETLLAGISVAIAAIPEEPPVLLAVILGLGAYRLLRRGVLVRRLNAEETLGGIDLILTDKTGTLTQNRLAVASVRDPGGVIEGDRRLELLQLAHRAEDDAWPRDGVVPGSFARALADAVSAAGTSGALDSADLVRAEPATDERHFSLTVARRPSGLEELALGAPEEILGLQTTPEPASRAGDAVDAGDAWHSTLDRATLDGERVLALARRADGAPWQVVALVGFADPLRPAVGDAFRTAGDAGIQTIIVTGDHPQTALAIARGAGLGATRAVVGSDLEAWDDERLGLELAGLHVVARSTPLDKQRLVAAAHRAGRTVAVTGDGVNDAPALHAADVAVAMGSGTAVAKEAADLVLGDDAFSTLIYGIAEGRRLVDNVGNGLVFLVSTHVALLGFIALGTIAGVAQPLLPIQILWLELFIDLSTSVAFEREPPAPDVMGRPPRPAGVPILTRELLGRLAGAGGVSAFGALVLLLWTAAPTGGGDSFQHARWLAFTALVAAQCVRAYANRSLTVPIHRLPRNTFLLSAVVVVVLVQAAIPFVPALADAFRATPLDAVEWFFVALIAFVPALLAEVMRMTGRRWVA
jgi:Ca2+-transporting ATPase